MYKAPTTPQEIKDTTKYFKLSANKDIGQHFLFDQDVLHAIVDEYAVYNNKQSTVLEVGPGLGVLTERLVQVADKVVSVELDRRLEPVLHALETQYDNLEIIRSDILRTQLGDYGLSNGNFTVVANLPYQITSHFIRQMLTQEPYPDRLILLVQKEVAERIVAEPGKLSVLALSVQAFADPEIIAMVPPEVFYPAPAIQSAILAINNVRSKKVFKDKQEEDMFFRIVKGGFAQKRKMLRKNLQNIRINEKSLSGDDIDIIYNMIGIKKTARAQEISLKQWLLMLDKIKTFVI